MPRRVRPPVPERPSPPPPWPILEIPGRPAGKKNSRRIVTPAGRSHSVLVPDARDARWARAAERLLWALWHPRGAITAPVHLALEARVHPQQRLDLANVVSAACDALEDAGVVRNDRLIVAIQAVRRTDAEAPGVTLTLTPWEDAP